MQAFSQLDEVQARRAQMREEREEEQSCEDFLKVPLGYTAAGYAHARAEEARCAEMQEQVQHEERVIAEEQKKRKEAVEAEQQELHAK